MEGVYLICFFAFSSLFLFWNVMNWMDLHLFDTVQEVKLRQASRLSNGRRPLHQTIITIPGHTIVSVSYHLEPKVRYR